jgi:hypothetical protein
MAGKLADRLEHDLVEKRDEKRAVLLVDAMAEQLELSGYWSVAWTAGKSVYYWEHHLVVRKDERSAAQLDR